MGKVVIKEKNGQTIITNKLLRTETVNELVCQSISAGKLEGLLPVSVERRRKKVRMIYSVQGLISLDKWNRLVTRRMFLDLVSGVIAIIRNCENNAMNSNNLDLKLDRIFIEPTSQRFKCVYWAVANNQHAEQSQHFFELLPSVLNFAPNEKKDYIDEYKSFFKSETPFSMNGFEKLICRLQGKSEKKSFVVPSDTHSETLVREEDRESDGVIIEYNPFDTIKTETISESTGNGKSTFFPALVKSDTGESFVIDKPLFRVGSKSDCCDLLISNKYISKSHADIVSRNGRYYIVDRGSTNKTYLDGGAIPVNREIEIFSGSRISFANESFEFNISKKQ